MFDLHGTEVPTITFTMSVMNQLIRWGVAEASEGCPNCGHGAGHISYNTRDRHDVISCAVWLQMVPEEFRDFAQEKVVLAQNRLNSESHYHLVGDETLNKLIGYLAEAIIDGVGCGELNGPVNFVEIKGQISF